MRSTRSRSLLCLAIALATASTAYAQPSRAPLSATNIDDIALLLMLEDTRRFDDYQLSRMLVANHPEVRRLAAQSVGRIVNPAGRTLLLSRPLDADTAVAATVVWAIGQLRDTASVGWLDSLLRAPATPPTVRNEAAIALGKIPGAPSRGALAAFLLAADADARTSPAIGSALLSIGRMPGRGDLAPVVRWATSGDDEIRWRATWALFRSRNPAAVPALLTLATDRSALIRSWAVRGLGMTGADSAGVAAEARARLLQAARSPDRAERTEAITALATYGDSAASAALVDALQSTDSWIAVAAATALANPSFRLAAPALRRAIQQSPSCAVRTVAFTALERHAPADAHAAVIDVISRGIPYCQNSGLQAANRILGTPTLSQATRLTLEQAIVQYRAARRAELGSSVVPTQLSAIRAMTGWADSTDIAKLREIAERTRNDSTPVSAAATAVIDAIARRSDPAAAPAGRGRGGAPASPVERPMAEYRRIVERWVVPAYMGEANPTARWETSRGTIDLELYAADAPLAVDDFVRRTLTGAIIGTEFTRVVPDFVDQMAGIAGGSRIRDEVNRRGLTRANLSWATAGLDTGNPGYTLGHTPQPHNEGNFTALGRVIGGMDVADRIELGDRILSARMLTRGR